VLGRARRSAEHTSASRCLAALVATALLGVVIGMTSNAVAGPPSTVVEIDKHVPYVPGGTPNQSADIYRQGGGATGRPAIVLVHGGGFAGGSPDDLSRQARLAAEQGWVTFNLDYRTTSVLGTHGEAWPAELDDVRTGLAWIRTHATEYGADPQLISMLGASAGGTLAALAAAEPSFRVRALALWSAPTDLRTLVPDASGVPPACEGNAQCLELWRNPWVTNMIGCTPDVCPLRYEQASPIAHTTLLPPTFVANATDEVVPLVQAQQLESKLRDQHKPTELQVVPGARHAQTYTESVWNQTMPFLADGLGVPAPEPVDFGESPFDIGWAAVAILLALVGIVVAVVARITADRSRGRRI
jgi:acetyl esterase/lipase